MHDLQELDKKEQNALSQLQNQILKQVQKNLQKQKLQSQDLLQKKHRRYHQLK